MHSELRDKIQFTRHLDFRASAIDTAIDSTKILKLEKRQLCVLNLLEETPSLSKSEKR